jgi:glycosyltransferase involved in cell wall biosynthesis
MRPQSHPKATLKLPQGSHKAWRLAVLSTHPIQYYAPVFRLLAGQEGLALKVFYGWKGATERAVDPGFGTSITWDIPLLDGYESEFVPNVASDPGTHHFQGIDLPDLHSRITAWQPDALLVFGWCWKAHLAALRHFHGLVPILFRGDSTLLDERPGFRTVARHLWLRWVYRHVDVALYVGTRNRDYYQAHGLKSDQLVFAPHAIDNQRFRQNSEEMEAKAASWRGSSGIKPDQVVFLFAGKLEPKKAPDLLLRTFNEARFSDPFRPALVFCGSGVLESSLRQNVGSDVHFLGFRNQTEMPWVYRAGNVVVLPSRGPGETWGLALNEAMACGRAVIASERVGAAVDLIEAGRNGWVFTAQDTAALTAVLKNAAVAGRQALSAMGQRSLELISAWSIERQVKGILAGMHRAMSAWQARS